MSHLDLNSGVPPEILEAANKVSSWFEQKQPKGTLAYWELGKICSRAYAYDLRALRDVFEICASPKLRALNELFEASDRSDKTET